jgi:hypothetical protein
MAVSLHQSLIATKYHKSTDTYIQRIQIMSFTLFASRKSEINSAIASIQSQITLLQQQLADQQAFLQEIGTVEQAGESALNQARTFLSMVRAIDPSQEGVFWQSMDALKNENLEALPPGNSEAAEPSPTPDTTPPSPEETTTVEVEATEVVEATNEEQADEVKPSETTDPLETTEEADADKPVFPLTAAEIKRIKWTDLQDICTKKNITDPSGQRLTRKFVERTLLGQLTSADIAHLA